jgi:hypothetical protein
VCANQQLPNFVLALYICTCKYEEKKREIGVLIGVQPLVTILTRICIQHLCNYAELWNPFHLLILELVHASSKFLKSSLYPSASKLSTFSNFTLMSWVDKKSLEDRTLIEAMFQRV